MKFFKELIHKLSDMLSGNDGYWSAMRWISVTTSNMIVFIWALISITKWELQTIPESVIAMFAVAVTGKWLQHTSESKENIAGAQATATQLTNSGSATDDTQPTADTP